MLCPLCRGRSTSGKTECAVCGVDFMKWLHLQGSKAHRGGGKRPRPRSWKAAAAAAGVAAVALLLWRARATDAGAPEHPSAPAATSESRSAAARLEPILAGARAEGTLYAVELQPDELLRRYVEGGRTVSDEGLASVAAAAGLGPPEETPLRDDEAALMAKCRKDGVWTYASLPARPEAGAECWAAGAGYPRRWVRQHWQPKRRAWSAYTQEDAARAVRYVLDERYSARREAEARAAASRELAQPGTDRRLALLLYYGFLAEREGALAALESF